MVAGSGLASLSTGIYAMHLEHLSGIDLQIDTISISNARGYGLIVEAEDYDAHQDLGGATIRAYPETGCGGGYFVYGLDTTGEWTQYNEPIAEGGDFQVGLTCRGQFNVGYELRLVFTDITATEAITWGAVKGLYE